MAKTDKYFYLSGLISFLIFVLFLFAALQMAISFAASKSFAFNKSKKIAVSIVLKSKDRTISSSVKKKPVKKNEPKKNQPPVPTKSADISSLFSSVSSSSLTTKVAKKKRKVDSKRLAAIEKRTNITKKKIVKKSSDSVKDIKLEKYEIEMSDGSAQSSADEVNEYFAKIHSFVYDNFYPPVNSEGHTVKVRISLNSSGTMTRFFIVALSKSELFNAEIYELEKRLSTLTFPKNPELKNSTFVIILTAQE